MHKRILQVFFFFGEGGGGGNYHQPHRKIEYCNTIKMNMQHGMIASKFLILYLVL